jgi:hypothetical protein
LTSFDGSQQVDGLNFGNRPYLQTLSILYSRYGKENLRMKKALLILTQAERHFFTYYSFANFFQDNLSIRVDRPDYTNIDGALGFFGSIASDTVAYVLPPDLSAPL